MDWSSGHAKHRKGALSAADMNVGYGGQQTTPRDSKIPDTDSDAKAYLGQHAASMVWKGKTLDLKLKPGDVQYFYFRKGDPPPFNKLDAPELDTPSGKKRKKNGEESITEGYVDKPKGMAQIAWERGWYAPDGKMHGKAPDEDDATEKKMLSLVYVLSNCWDFAHEKTALEDLFESRGHILRMCVKGHPELAGQGIEYAWGRAKQVTFGLI